MSDTALLSALAGSGQIQTLEGREYHVTSDIHLTAGSGLVGRGRATVIVLDGCSIVVDDEDETLLEKLVLKPASAGTQPLLHIRNTSHRHTSRDVYFTGHDGTSGTARSGVKIESSHTPRFYNCEWISLWQAGVTWVDAGAGNVTCNSPQFYGCRISGCISALDINGVSGLLWSGGEIEGCSGLAIQISNSRICTFHGVHIEGNGFSLATPDRHVVEIGGGSALGQSITFDDCWWTSAHAMDSFIRLNLCKTLYCRGGLRGGTQGGSIPFVTGQDLDAAAQYPEVDERLKGN